MKIRLAIAFACLAVGVTSAQVRGDRQAAPGGPALISGIVVSSADSRHPVSRAIVTLSGDGLAVSRTAISDERGLFAFANLPAAQFTLAASKAAYIRGEYGELGPGRPGTPLVVSPGQQLTDLTLVLPRGAVITGRVLDARGEPADGVEVAAIPVHRLNGRSDPARTTTATTDDLGEYRLYGLVPGSYEVSATPGWLAGGEIDVPTSAELDAEFQKLAQRLQTGAVGAQVPAASSAAASAQFAVARPFGVAPIYYSGTASVADASPVVVAQGEERKGVDFQLSYVPLAAVSGAITNMDQAPGGVQMTITSKARPDRGTSIATMSVGAPRLSLRPGPDGRFVYDDVVPGQYLIQVRSQASGAGGGPRSGISGGVGGSLSPRPVPLGGDGVAVFWAAADVTVNGEDMEGLSLTLQPALHLSGRVEFDTGLAAAFDQSTGAAGPASAGPPQDLTSIEVRLTAVDATGSSSINSTTMGRLGAPPAQVRPDGTFELTGILPDTYRLSAAAPSGWWLRSAVVNGRDVLDAPLVIAPDTELTRAVLTLTNRHNEVTGTVTDSSGQSSSAFLVVIFPADPVLRTAERRVRSTRPSVDGRYVFRDLPGGDYLIAALTDVDPDDLGDADFLAQIAPAALGVVVKDGGSVRNDLRLRAR